MRTANGYHAFEELCFELARATISANVLRPSGPVGAGGDQGRDFETYATQVPGQVRRIGAELGLRGSPAVSYACTLQQDSVDAKVLADVAKTMATGPPVNVVVAYCEADIPVGRRHKICDAARERWGCRLEVFDGNAIADLLATEPGLEETVERLLFVRAGAEASPVPRGVPVGPLRFVNRQSELAALDTLVEDQDEAAGPAVALLSGMHGVGKSAVGMHWIRRRRDRFPDGDLFGDFSKRRHGSSVDVGEVLGRFLRDVGSDERAIPASLGDKQRLFRQMTDGKRILVMLDDVESAAQALAAMPGGSGSMVVVTTRHRLEELVWSGASFVPVAPLIEEEAVELLAAIAGPRRLESDSVAVVELVRLCAGLPIALCVSGGRLAVHPEWEVRDFVDRVAATPLRALSGTGDFDTAAIFDFAYSDLRPDDAVVYRRLGLHPGADFSGAIVQLVVGEGDGLDSLDRLVEAHLVEPHGAGRFRLHDLVWRHCRACSDRDDAAEQQTDVSRRFVDWYYASARAADWAVVADRLRLTDRLEVNVAGVPRFDSPKEVFEWFAVEHANVMAAIRLANQREWNDRVWQFAEALWPLCMSHKRYAEWIESQSLAAEASRRSGDAAAEARVRSQLAMAYAELGRCEECQSEMDSAFEAAAVCDNAMLRASVTEFGGVCCLRLGDAGLARELFVDARRQFEACGSARGVAIQDLHLGWAGVRLGEHEAAIAWLERARDGLEATNDPIGVGRVLVHLGEAQRLLGRRAESRKTLQTAIALMESLGIRFEQAEALESLAELAGEERDSEFARLHRQRAYEIYRELGHPRAAALLDALGEVA